MRYWFNSETKNAQKYMEMEELIKQYPRCEDNIREENVIRGRSHLCGGDATRILNHLGSSKICRRKRVVQVPVNP